MIDYRKAVLLFWLVFFVWMPVFQAGFIWDDDTFLTQNPLIQSDKGIIQCWISLDAPDYLPLTFTSLWIEWRLWGINASGYHITNVLIHLMTCIAIACVFYRLKWPGGWIAAMLYAVHPVNVESVAWITQRKNVLCFFFTLLTILTYIGVSQKKPQQSLFLSGIFFTCALLSKAAAIMLPLWLIILAYYQWHQNVRTTIRQIFPLIFISIIFAGITLFYQHSNAMEHLAVRHDSLPHRFFFAFQALLFYLTKAIYPESLCFIYDIRPNSASMITGLCLFVIITICCYYKQRDSIFYKAIILGLSFYLINLLPVLGFFDIYFMKFSWVADHWQSLSLMGITSLTGAFLGFVHQQSFRIKVLTIIFTVLLVATLSVKTYNQCKKYKSESILWTDTLACNPRSIVPHDRMALIAVAQNDYQRAQYHLQQSILIDPNNWQAHMNAGNLFNKQHQTERAKNQYLKALAIHPNRLEILINLGQLYIEEKEYESAKTYFLKALSLEPGNAYVNYQLGMLLMREGKFGEALFYFQSVIEVSPDHMASHLHMGRILSDRRPFEAIRHLNKCLLVQDIQKEAHSLLGVIYCRLCRCKQAKYHYEQAEKEFNISACCHSSKKR